MSGLALHHVQLAIPAGAEDDCRAFYIGVLGMEEVAKPPALVPRDSLWVRSGTLEIHLGVEAEFQPARKAHPGILVADLDGRFHTFDNVGNRLELMTPA